MDATLVSNGVSSVTAMLFILTAVPLTYVYGGRCRRLLLSIKEV